MAYVSGLLSFLVVAVWVYCLVDVATTPTGQARFMNKWFWLALVAFFSVAGALAWLVFGKPRRVPAGVGRPPGAPHAPPEERPAKPPHRPRRPPVLAPDDDPEFLRRLDEIAELERRARDDEPPAPGAPGS